MDQVMIKEYGYEYDASLDAPLWEITKCKVTHEKLWGAICLRSGRDALKTIAREYKPTIVFMPALACDSMVVPFEMYGHKVIYYRLTSNYKVDIQQVKKLVPNKEVLFLYMDYFGILSISDEELYHLKNTFTRMVFIEDRTHNLIWEKVRQFVPDYTMASLRKWLNVPDGGLLWPKDILKKTDFAEDTSFSSTRLKAQCMRRKFFTTGDQAIKTAYRKIFSTVSDIMDKDKKPSRMTAYSHSLASQANWDEIRQKRKENAKTLISILQSANIDFIQPNAGASDLYVAFKVIEREHKQAKLSSKGIFNTIIWPLGEKQKQICSVAKDTEQMMLAAPCDQRYTIDDMKIIGREMVRIFNE